MGISVFYLHLSVVCGKILLKAVPYLSYNKYITLRCENDTLTLMIST